MLVRKTAVILFLFCVALSPLRAEEWRLRVDREGIRVSTRNVPGSVFMEFRAEADIEASIPTILAVFADVEACPEWCPGVAESRVLERVGDAEMIVYQCFKAPWPVAKRDSVYRGVTKVDPVTGIVTVQFIIMPGYLPEREGIIRVKRLDAIWTLVPDREKGTVRASYQQHNEPGGKLPAWLANSYVTKRPFSIMKNLREMVKKEKYKGK